MADTFLSIENLDEVLAKLDTKKLLGKAVEKFLLAAARATLNKMMDRSPVQSGLLRASLGVPEAIEIDTAAIPEWVRVGTNVNANGFPYPKALDESERYHYRSRGDEGLYGQPTKGWFSESPSLLADKYRQLSDDMLSDVGKEWEDE